MDVTTAEILINSVLDVIWTLLPPATLEQFAYV